MKREFLKELGLEKEVIDKILNENGRDIQVEKDKVAEKEKEIDALNNTLSDANKEIDSYKNMNIEEIKKNATEWKEKYEKSLEEMTNFKNNSRLEKEIGKYNALDNDLLLKVLNRENLSFKDESIIGLDESIAELKKSHPTLFKTDEPEGNGQGSSGQFKSINVPEGSSGEDNSIQAQLDSIFNN